MARVNVDTEPTGPLPTSPGVEAARLESPESSEGAVPVPDEERARPTGAAALVERVMGATRGRSERRSPRPAKTAKPARPPRVAKSLARSAARPAERRYRQTIRKVDLWSVLKISVCFYLCGLVVLLAAGTVLWGIASGVGVVDKVESFIGDLLGSNDFEFLSWRILRGATLVGLVGVCLMVVCTVLAAAFYNLFSEVLGGIEVTVTEEEATRRQR